MNYNYFNMEDHYLTTYMRDYLWPYGNCDGLVNSEKHMRGDQNDQDGKVWLFCLPKDFTNVKHKLPFDQNWSRNGPLGQLLGPKLYPTKEDNYNSQKFPEYQGETGYAKEYAADSGYCKDPCKEVLKPRFGRCDSFTKEYSHRRRDFAEQTTPIMGIGKSEYQDVISKLGGIIIRDKLHLRR